MLRVCSIQSETAKHALRGELCAEHLVDSFPIFGD